MTQNNIATKDRITNAIRFFRNFSNSSNNDIYRKAVLRFCDLVETFEQDIAFENNVKSALMADVPGGGQGRAPTPGMSYQENGTKNE